MERINVAELLKDCPQGMELDCTMYEGLEFDGINAESICTPIRCRLKGSDGIYKTYNFTKYGCWSNLEYAKCVIFPKGKTTWEGFQRPFEDGDIVFTHANCLKVGLGNTWISIFQEKRNGGVATYIDMTEDGKSYYDYIDGSKSLLCMDDDIMRQRFATEEEKQKLFQAIKEHGYKWNEETKTLETLIKPKFKVGDKIIKKNGVTTPMPISKITNDYYCFNSSNSIEILPIKEQDDWELAPNKFDINTLKPFDKVLGRNKSNEVWTANFYSHYDATSDKPFICVGWSEMNEYRYCIPYEVNKELLGTTNDCDEFYKTW